MKRFLKNFRFGMLGIAVLCVLLGVAILVHPDGSLKLLCYGFGAILVLSGVLQIGSYLIGERVGFLKKLLLISGIICAVVGVWILLAPEKILRLVAVVLGILLLYHGFMDIRYAFTILENKGQRMAVPLVFGILTCGLGVVVLVNPFAADKALVMLMGISFIFDGVTDIYTDCAVAGARRHAELLAEKESYIQLDPSAASIVSDSGVENKESSEVNGDSVEEDAAYVTADPNDDTQ